MWKQINTTGLRDVCRIPVCSILVKRDRSKWLKTIFYGKWFATDSCYFSTDVSANA